MSESKVYQCPRCATSMQVDPVAKAAFTNLSQDQYDALVRDAMAYRATPESDAWEMTREDVIKYGEGRQTKYVEVVFVRKLERQKASLINALRRMVYACNTAESVDVAHVHGEELDEAKALLTELGGI